MGGEVGPGKVWVESSGWHFASCWGGWCVVVGLYFLLWCLTVSSIWHYLPLFTPFLGRFGPVVTLGHLWPPQWGVHLRTYVRIQGCRFGILLPWPIFQSPWCIDQWGAISFRDFVIQFWPFGPFGYQRRPLETDWQIGPMCWIRHPRVWVCQASLLLFSSIWIHLGLGLKWGRGLSL